MLKFNVSSNYFSRSSAPYRPNKVSITLQLPSLQSITQSWVTSKQLSCRYTLHNLHYLARTVFRRGCQKQMHMVRHHFHSINLKLIPLLYPAKDLIQTFCYWPRENKLSVLGKPNKMVLEIADGVFRTFDRTHSLYRSKLIRLRRIFTFLSRRKLGRYLAENLYEGRW